MLIIYLYIIDTLKKFKFLAAEGDRSVPHEDSINMIISKSEAFLAKVANDESQAMRTAQSLSIAHSFIKDLLLQLKKELTDNPKYSYLRHD